LFSENQAKTIFYLKNWRKIRKFFDLPDRKTDSIFQKKLYGFFTPGFVYKLWKGLNFARKLWIT